MHGRTSSFVEELITREFPATFYHLKDDLTNIELQNQNNHIPKLSLENLIDYNDTYLGRIGTSKKLKVTSEKA